MNVNELQQFLRSLAQPLTLAGGKKLADDLERAAAGMEHVREMSITEFADFLERAEHLVRTGELPPSGKASRASRAPKAGSEERVKEASQRLASMIERASDDDFEFENARIEIQALNSLTIGELHQVAQELNITRKFRTKNDLLEALERLVRGEDETPADNDPAEEREAPVMSGTNEHEER